MEWIEKSVEDVCLLPKPKDVVFPEDRTNEEMHLLCKKLRGHMSVTDSQAKQDVLAKEYQRMLPEKYDEGWKGKFKAPVMASGLASIFLLFQLCSGQASMILKMKVTLQTTSIG